MMAKSHLLKLLLVFTLLTISSFFTLTIAGLPTSKEVKAQLRAHFNGLNFSVGVIKEAPFVIKDPSRRGNAAWSGVSVEQIKKLATEYGFTIKRFVELKNMTYDKAVEHVGSGEAGVDIACQLFTSTATREQVASLTKSPVDFSFVYIRSAGKDFKKKFGALFAPFSLDLWALVILSLPVMSLILTFFESDNKSELHHANWFIRFLRNIYSNTSLLFGQLTFTTRRPECLLVILAWMLFTFGLTAIYTANLASFLTRRRSSFFSTEDFILGRSPIPHSRLIVPAGSSMAAYVDRNIKTKLPHVKFERCADGCAPELVEHGDAVAIMDCPFVQYLMNKRYSGKLEIVSESFFPQSSAWVLPRNSRHTKAFSDAIVAHRDNGSFEKILKSFTDTKCSRSLNEETDQIGTGTNLGGLFIVTAALILAAFCTYFWRRYKERQLLTEDI